jgi:PiT family inorganic phosphate transporter
MIVSLGEFITQVFSNYSLLIIVVLLSFVIFANGFADAPNAIATCVSTRAISPKKALIMAAIFNFLGIAFMSMVNAGVAKTIFNIANFGSDSKIALLALSAALISIITWAFSAGRLGIPTSESHALIAAITGSSVALFNNFSNVNGKEWTKVLLGIVISIVLGFIVGLIITKIIELIFKNVDRRNTLKGFKYAQIFGGAFLAFMHGAQAGLKFIGVFILGIMIYNGNTTLDFNIPLWLMIYCALLMTIGTSIGGYKIIKTIGSKMSKLELYQGTATDIATSLCLLMSSIFGIPVSTSHTKSLAITGVVASRRISSINFNTIKNILLAGIITFPCCGLLAFLLTKVLLFIF